MVKHPHASYDLRAYKKTDPLSWGLCLCLSGCGILGADCYIIKKNFVSLSQHSAERLVLDIVGILNIRIQF